MDEKFKIYVDCAMHYKDMTKEYTNKICKILTREAPRDNIWYFRDGFFRVDVAPSDYNDYMDFIEGLLGCSYCHIQNTNGLTFLMSLSTLHQKL